MPRLVPLARPVRLVLGAAGAVLLGLAALASCGTQGPIGDPGRPAEKRLPGAVGNTLFTAARVGDLARVKAIVEQSPRLVAAEDAGGWNALSYAAWSGQKAVYDYLISRGGQTSLFTQAALGPFPPFLETLKARPAAVREMDPREKATPLLWAARVGNAAGCEYLLSRGAEVNAADREGDTALHHSVSRGDAQLSRTLLQAGAIVGAANRNGWTPLHLACAGGGFELVELLLDGGAPLAAADEDGDTPLHAAAIRGRFDICEYLLLRGAPRQAKNRRGETARDQAVAGGYVKLAELLKERL